MVLGTESLSCFVVRGSMGLPFFVNVVNGDFLAEVVGVVCVRCDFGKLSCECAALNKGLISAAQRYD